jgi:hypothetical protein
MWRPRGREPEESATAVGRHMNCPLRSRLMLRSRLLRCRRTDARKAPQHLGLRTSRRQAGPDRKGLRLGSHQDRGEPDMGPAQRGTASARHDPPEDKHPQPVARERPLPPRRRGLSKLCRPMNRYETASRERHSRNLHLTLRAAMQTITHCPTNSGLTGLAGLLLACAGGPIDRDPPRGGFGRTSPSPRIPRWRPPEPSWPLRPRSPIMWS